MERRKVLVIGMFDSIHLARWLSQFVDEKIDFVLFPSKKFRYTHPELVNLIKSKHFSSYSLGKPYFVSKYIGFIDYICIMIFRIIHVDIKKYFLTQIIVNNSFEYVHAIEIQGAGYLYTSLPNKILDKNRLIITNYGSDIIYYGDNPHHKIKINSVFSIAKYYSGECQRDYEIALSMGFNGKLLPCIPNAGGFKDEVFDLNIINSNSRNIVMAKCYGGEFGLGELVIKALSTFLLDKKDLQVFLYSVTDDLLDQAIHLEKTFPRQIKLVKIRDKIDRMDFLKYFASAKIYIGASKSDGISTAFLEALCLGAYPIQTNTSCANEWIGVGFNGSVIAPNLSAILEALEIGYKDSNADQKRITNLNLARMHLSFEVIKSQALKFYGVDV